MYCPQCGVEYRSGFTRCADCDVELVYEPPASASGMGEAGGQTENPEDPFCSFWRGDDPRIHAELCELLNEEAIPHKTVRREDHLFNLNTKSAFEIGIPFSQFEKAEAAIKNAYGTQEEQPDAARLLPYGKNLVTDAGIFSMWLDAARGYASLGRYIPEGFESDAADASGRKLRVRGRKSWDPENWFPKDAITEVWSSDQAYPGEIVLLSLRENQIHARFENRRGRYAIWVLPEDEAQAKEIVREVVEGAPPE